MDPRGLDEEEEEEEEEPLVYPGGITQEELDLATYLAMKSEQFFILCEVIVSLSSHTVEVKN